MQHASSNERFSLRSYFRKKLKEITPEFSFADFSGPFEKWRSGLIEKLRELMGDFPEPCDLNPKIIAETETEDGLSIKKLVIDTEKHFSVPAWLIHKKGIAPGSPAVICHHGHGEYGKDGIAGLDCGNPARLAHIKGFKYGMAKSLAQEGFVTISHDARGFGELDQSDPTLRRESRDPCNVNFNRGLILGSVMLTLNTWDSIRITDYLSGLELVDEKRIGECGISLGGTRTVYHTINDKRIKAAVVSGYLTETRHYAIDKANFCGSQLIPGIYKYADVPDIIGLIAGRPLLLQSGICEEIFDIEYGVSCIDKVREIYKAAGAENSLEADIFEGTHQFNHTPILSFFKRNL